MLQGAIIGGIVGLVMAAIGYMVAASMQKSGRAIGNPYTAHLKWAGEYQKGLEAAKNALAGAGAMVTGEEPATGRIFGKTKASAMTFGMSITIQFHGQTGATNVDITVAHTLQKVDHGKPQLVLAEFERQWFALRGTSASTPPLA